MKTAVKAIHSRVKLSAIFAVVGAAVCVVVLWSTAQPAEVSVRLADAESPGTTAPISGRPSELLEDRTPIDARTSSSGRVTCTVYAADELARPVSNVSVTVAPHNGTSHTEATDAKGQATFEAPTSRGKYVIDAHHGSLVALDVPRILHALPPKCTILLVSEITIEGFVFDPNGAPVSGAHVHWSWPQRDSKNIATSVVGRRKAKTSDVGRFEFSHRGPIPEGVSLIVSDCRYPPHIERFDLQGVTQSRVVKIVRLRAGAELTITFKNTHGVLLKGFRVNIMTHTTPILESWEADEVPGDAGEELGLRSVDGLTDGKGVFRLCSWPTDRPARLTIYDRGSRNHFRHATAGVIQSRRVLVLPRGATHVDVTVEQIPKQRLTIEGTAQGLTAEERKKLRLIVDFGGGGRKLLRLSWPKEDLFRATAEIAAERLDGKRVTVVVERSSTRRQRFGPYILSGDYVIRGIVVER